MAQEHEVVAIYHTHTDAEAAIKRSESLRELGRMVPRLRYFL
jgi:hypothetical protein